MISCEVAGWQALIQLPGELAWAPAGSACQAGECKQEEHVLWKACWRSAPEEYGRVTCAAFPSASK